MRIELIGCFMLIVLSGVELFAQPPVATKIDEFGTTNCDNYRALFDNSLHELNRYPGAKGYVLVYEGDVEQRLGSGQVPAPKDSVFVPSEKGFGKDVTGYLKTHLSFRNFPLDRVLFVNGGFRDRFVVEVWLVPHGAEAPKPSPTRTKIRQRKRTRKPWGFCGEM